MTGSSTSAPEDDGNEEEFVEDSDAEEEEYEPDRWMLRGDTLTRIHNVPRTKMFTPEDRTIDPCPIPLKYIDSWRTTTFANLERKPIDDIWGAGNNDNREIDDYLLDWQNFIPLGYA